MSMDDTAGGSKKREFKRLYIANFQPEVIQAHVAAKGKMAPLYDDVCRTCHKLFTVRSFTALAQFKREASRKQKIEFIPPTMCKHCYTKFSGIAIPTPPTNASIKKRPISVKPDSVPPALNKVSLAVSRRNFEGKEVVLYFKKKVGFSTSDESYKPTTGVVLAVARTAIIINDRDAPTHDARTYPLCDLEKITLSPDEMAKAKAEREAKALLDIEAAAKAAAQSAVTPSADAEQTA